jgi:hypothetical protein
MEGSVEWRAPPPGAVPPAYEYPHIGERCAITGGYVYRGRAIPALAGWYLFADYCTGTIGAFRLVDGRPVDGTVGARVASLVSFGQDQRGELYALSLAGAVYRLVP